MRVTIDSVSKTYTERRGRAVEALHDVSLAIGDGEFVTVLGPSGCGKSTLLHIVAGLTAPTRGRVVFADVPGGTAMASMVFQEHALFPWRTVLGNVVFGLEVRGLAVPDRRPSHRMNRLTFLLGLTLGAWSESLLGEGQPAGKVYRVGTLHSASREDAAPRIAALGLGLGELGYVPGRDIVFVHRYADAKLTRVDGLAVELVQNGVDVVVTATNPTTAAMMKATTSIPIVMTVGVEPVSAGLVASITRPGGNVTGLTFDVDPTQLAGKRLEILKELVPSLGRAGVLWNPTYGPAGLRFKGTEDAGRKLGIAVISVRATEPGKLEDAFAELQRARPRRSSSCRTP